jgi:membrane-associated phospholipid phosphatase
VRIHHASDVVGGAIMGSLMGAVGLVFLNAIHLI